MRGDVIEQLLSGRFICPVSDEDAHAWLQDADARASVDSVLAHVNRRVAQSGDTFFAAYVSLDQDALKAVRGQFAEISGALGPLIRWLVLAQEAVGHEAPLRSGDAIRATTLLRAAEDVPAIRDALGRLSRLKAFGCTSDAPEAQVRQTLQRMLRLGYLVQPSPDRQVYLLTGKVDYLHEVLRLIDAAENLGLESLAEPPEQGLLLQ